MKPLLIFVLLLTPAASGQLISVGVRGGAPFTGAFTSVTDIPPPDYDKIYSGSKEYIAGAMVELHLPLGFSVEGDALYRPLNLSSDTNTGTAIYHHSPCSVREVAWAERITTHGSFRCWRSIDSCTLR